MQKRGKKGVSPVIGVILMVAATIVIAAVVMAMLGGFSPPGRTYAVSATASVTPNASLQITYQGGPDHAQVDYIRATVVDSTGRSINSSLIDYINSGWGSDSDSGKNDVTVGATLVINSSIGTFTPNIPNDDHVVVRAAFVDGTQQVILDIYV